MKFAICNETFQDWTFDRAFAFAAECGYTGVEIAPFTIARHVAEIPAARRQEIRRQADAAGLEVVGLHWLLAKTEGLHLTHPDPAVRRRTAEYLADLARLCVDLGGSIMVFGSPQQRSLLPGVSPQQGADFAAEVLTAVLPVLEDGGVVLALEPLTPQETDFLTTAALAVELIGRIGSPHVRLHLDCKAMSSEPTPIPELIARHHALLAHLHANDPNRQGPGFGQLDFRPIFQALGEVDYQGWVSVEVFDYAPGIKRLARESMVYMQRCLDCALG
ncbi:MAG: sugar phosphate isomerase/epimerase family protein [Thermoguttaceae bacterium]|jgi:sugar phosphate isomerase/epimerase